MHRFFTFEKTTRQKIKKTVLLMSIDNLVDLSTVLFQKGEVSKHTYTPTMDTSFPFQIDQSICCSLCRALSSQKRQKQSTRRAKIKEDKEKQIAKNHSNLLQKITFRSSFCVRGEKKTKTFDEINVVLCLLLHTNIANKYRMPTE